MLLGTAGLLAVCALALVPNEGLSGTASPVPSFRHALIVVFENKERREIVGNPAAPTFTALARRYATLSAYQAVAHPSLPNYLALVSGSTHGIP